MSATNGIPNESLRPTDATQYLALLSRWWWLLIAGATIAGAAAFFVTSTIAPTYRASATLLINQVETPGSIVYSDVLTSERLTKTYRELITKRPILESVVAQSGEPGLTVDELASKLDTHAVKDTQLVTVSVSDQSPARAARLANQVAQTFVQEESSDALTRAGTTRVVEPASVPSVPISPNLRLNVALAVLMGIVLAGGLALLIEYLDDTIKSSDDVSLAAGLPTLGEVGRLPHDKDRIPLSTRGLPTHEAETYAILRTNIQFSSIARPARVILVASANSGDGKSTTSANFALACAESGKRVALVDADLRRPTLHRAFGLENTTGLTSVLLDGASLDDESLIPTSHPNLFVVPSGPLPPNPTELLEWVGFDAVIEQIKSKVDLIVIDSSPLLAVADARILAAKADATILVVEQGRTRASALRAAYHAIARADANILGVVLNKVRRGRGSYGSYYYDRAYAVRGRDGSGGKNGRGPRRLPALATVGAGPSTSLGRGDSVIGLGRRGDNGKQDVA